MLVIDAGNSRVKFARVARRHATPHILTAIDTSQLRISHVKEIRHQSECHTAVAACVVQTTSRTLHAGWPALHILNPSSSLNFSTKVNRKTIGADRLANMAQAAQKFRKNVLVADFGTAATFDVLDEEGCFCGGAIAPGLHTMMQSLALAADQLPEIALKAPKQFRGRNTTEALRAGVIGGYTGLVQYLLTQLSKKSTCFVFTGGDARVVAKLTKSTPIIDPLWTLRGIAVLGDWNAQKK